MTEPHAQHLPSEVSYLLLLDLRKIAFLEQCCNIKFYQCLNKTPTETLKRCTLNLPCRVTRFTNGIGDLKGVENPLKTMNALEGLRFHGRREILR